MTFVTKKEYLTFRGRPLAVMKILLDLLNGKHVRLDTLSLREYVDLIFRISREGKILSALCNFTNVFPERFHNYLENRCRLTELYMEYSKIISNELNDKNVEFYYFKTFKPFPYDLTDIDVLLMNRKDVYRVANILIKKLGFKVVSKGTYSLTLRKSINKFDVDLDLQPGVYAGTFEYLPISEIRKIIDIGYIREGIPLLRPELELAVIAGHTFFKDFKIALANLVYVDHLLKTIRDDMVLFLFERYPYIVRSIMILNKVINTFKTLISDQTNAECPYDVDMMLRGIYKQVITGKGVFNIPLTYIVNLYYDAFLTLLRMRDYGRIKELVLLPSSRGIRTLFERLSIV